MFVKKLLFCGILLSTIFSQNIQSAAAFGATVNFNVTYQDLTQAFKDAQAGIDNRVYNSYFAIMAQNSKWNGAGNSGCIDMEGWSSAIKSRIMTYRCNDLITEWTSRFRFEKISGTKFKFKLDQNRGLCIDYNGAKIVQGTKLFLWPCSAADASSWFIEEANNNQVYIKNNDDPSFCLDINGWDNKTPQLWKCNYTDNQKFSIKYNTFNYR
jgi:hypothetical protein